MGNLKKRINIMRIKRLLQTAGLMLLLLCGGMALTAQTNSLQPRLSSADRDHGFEEFRREVLKIPQILECHLVSGEYDYLIKVRLQDMSAYRDMLGKILLQLPSAVESRSYVVMEEVKENGPLALEDWED